MLAPAEKRADHAAACVALSSGGAGSGYTQGRDAPGRALRDDAALLTQPAAASQSFSNLSAGGTVSVTRSRITRLLRKGSSVMAPGLRRAVQA